MGAEQVRRARPLLGTLVDIAASGADAVSLHRAVDRAFHEIARVHALMSFHASGSDVTRLNRLAHRASVTVHPWTFAVLREARLTARASRGLFDITVAPRLVRAGVLPVPRGVPRPHPRAHQDDVVLLAGNRVRFRRPLLIDLGGIAKGFAVDRALHALRAAGVPQAMVNAGGDIACYGSEAQTIHVRLPGAAGGVVPLGQLRGARWPPARCPRMTRPGQGPQRLPTFILLAGRCTAAPASR
jgi:thiamine biosynthesis lipoprotein